MLQETLNSLGECILGIFQHYLLDRERDPCRRKPSYRNRVHPLNVVSSRLGMVKRYHSVLE